MGKAETWKKQGQERRVGRWETKIEWVSERKMVVVKSQVQHTNTYTVPPRILNYFHLLSILLLFSLQPTTPSRVGSASRHHRSAFSDCLHADGCRDYARHFWFCSTDWSVVFFLCIRVYLFGSLVAFWEHTHVRSIKIVSTLMSEMCAVIGQYFASTMVIVGMSVVATVIVLQFHHHSPDSGHMPHWVSYNKLCNNKTDLWSNVNNT